MKQVFFRQKWAYCANYDCLSITKSSYTSNILVYNRFASSVEQSFTINDNGLYRVFVSAEASSGGADCLLYIYINGTQVAIGHTYGGGNGIGMPCIEYIDTLSKNDIVKIIATNCNSNVQRNSYSIYRI